MTVKVPYTAWTMSYTGTFLFRLTWGGQPCAMATPAVVTQVLTMMAGGQLVTKTDDSGHAPTGTDPEPCVPSSNQFAEFIDGLPFGPATLQVVGEDGSGSAVFANLFQTFVGAGKSNPTLDFDMPLPDAGVPDAPPDAGSGSDGSDGSGSGSGSGS